jgi:serine/threonine protein kinase
MAAGDRSHDPTLPAARDTALEPTSAASESTAPVPSEGRLPARYQLAGKLGAGGMGEVLLATDQQIGREVAIKRILATSSDAQARFLREAKIQGRLDHPAIVPVHELATDSAGRPFFAMKRLTGTTLADVLLRESPRFSRAKLLRAFADVCLAVEFAHSRGIVHRDLKPANIMLGDFGEVYVLDWGVARALDEQDTPSGEHVADPSDGMTAAGAILGTPGYIAPELLRGQRLDARADVYALGCILFEILAGESLLPHGKESLSTTIQGKVERRPSVRAPHREVPPELDSLCIEATEPVRDQRLASTRELSERVERYLDGDRDLAQRRKLAGEHLEQARAARARGDGTAERAAAMREAGRAIALDPQNTDAAELVSRLMLEPPREVPHEVEEYLEEVASATARGKAATLGIVFASFLAFGPVLWWIGLRSPWILPVFLASVLGDGAYIVSLSHQKRPISVAQLHAAAVITTVCTFLLSWMFTPFLVAPGIAAISAFVFTIDPRTRNHTITAALIISTLAPLALELAGVWPHSVRSLGGTLILETPAVIVRSPHAEIALAIFVGSLIALSSLLSRRIGISHRAALRSAELQAWHLRQLVR